MKSREWFFYSHNSVDLFFSFSYYCIKFKNELFIIKSLLQKNKPFDQIEPKISVMKKKHERFSII